MAFQKRLMYFLDALNISLIKYLSLIVRPYFIIKQIVKLDRSTIAYLSLIFNLGNFMDCPIFQIDSVLLRVDSKWNQDMTIPRSTSACLAGMI